MRVTNRDLYAQLVRDIGLNSEKLLALNKQISSAKRINKPSEDPVGMASVLTYRTELNADAQFQKTIIVGQGWAKQTDSDLQLLDDLLGRARELVAAQGADTATALTRSGAAKEVEEIRKQILGIANTKYGNKFMYGGTLTQTQPFLDVNLDLWQDDVSTISATRPASPTDGQRIIDTSATGNNHIWSYSSATSTWTDLGVPADGTTVQVTDQGDELYVYDTTAGWQKQYQGNDDTFSVKIGKNDAVQVNIPGNEIFRDSTGDIFKTLMKLERALKNNDVTSIQSSLPDIKASSQVVANNLASVGARVNRFQSTNSMLKDAVLNITERKSDIEDLDYAEALTSLQNQQLIYQASLKSASLITQLSLVDFIS